MIFQLLFQLAYAHKNRSRTKIRNVIMTFPSFHRIL